MALHTISKGSYKVHCIFISVWSFTFAYTNKLESLDW